MIPYGKQCLSDDDIEQVLSVLKSDFLTQGPCVRKFEEAICKTVSSKYAVATNSATSALHIACLSLGLGDGDILWTSPITFVASANCARYCNAEVDFVDIELDSFNISPIKLEEKLIDAEKKNKLPKVIVVVHMCGQPADMHEIWMLSKRFGFSIIEDASHALGAESFGKKVGCCQFSDITVFSFHPVKIITTGEGGMAVTNSKKLAQRLGLFRSHGVDKEVFNENYQVDGPWCYHQTELGYNYRISDIQSALGLSQLKKLDEFVEKRNQVAKWYDQLLSETKLITPKISQNRKSSFHLYVVRVDAKLSNSERREVFERLRSDGIGVQVHYIPVYKQPYYRKLGFSETYCENAEMYYSQAISIPMFPALAYDDIVQVANKMKSAVT